MRSYKFYAESSIKVLIELTLYLNNPEKKMLQQPIFFTLISKLSQDNLKAVLRKLCA